MTAARVASDARISLGAMVVQAITTLALATMAIQGRWSALGSDIAMHATALVLVLALGFFAGAIARGITGGIVQHDRLLAVLAGTATTMLVLLDVLGAINFPDPVTWVYVHAGIAAFTISLLDQCSRQGHGAGTHGETILPAVLVAGLLLPVAGADPLFTSEHQIGLLVVLVSSVAVTAVVLLAGRGQSPPRCDARTWVPRALHPLSVARFLVILLVIASFTFYTGDLTGYTRALVGYWTYNMHPWAELVSWVAWGAVAGCVSATVASVVVCPADRKIVAGVKDFFTFLGASGSATGLFFLGNAIGSGMIAIGAVCAGVAFIGTYFIIRLARRLEDHLQRRETAP